MSKGLPTEMEQPTILVVDDEPSIRDLIVAVLEEEGYLAHGAHSGSAALDLVPELRPDLVLLDMMMPQMDGRETIRRLRQLPDGRRTLVIVMSAAVSAEHAGEGMAAFIAKPFDLVALLDTIASVLDGEAPETLSNPS